MNSLNYFFSAFPKYLLVLPLTLWLVAAPVLIGSLLAVPIAIARIKRGRVTRKIAVVYVSFMRGTPMIAQLFLVYFALPLILSGMGLHIDSWEKSRYAVIAFSLNLAAFTSEIYRSAYLSIDKGQIEAGLSIGMSEPMTFFRIIVPQALKVALPNISNNTVDLLKNTSLAFSIGVVDIMGRATQLSSASYGLGQLEMFLAAALCYWILCQLITKGCFLLEKRLDKGGQI